MLVLTALTAAALAAPKTTVDDWKLSVTLSPLHLALPKLRPAVGLTGELKLGPRYSASAIGGVGFGDPVRGMGGLQVAW